MVIIKCFRIEEVIDEQGKLSQQDLAYASAVKAIIGGLYTHCGESAAKDFINDHILSRKFLWIKCLNLKDQLVN